MPTFTQLALLLLATFGIYVSASLIMSAETRRPPALFVFALLCFCFMLPLTLAIK